LAASVRSAELDQTLELDLVLGGVTRGANQIYNVIFHFVVDVDVVNELPRLENLVCVYNTARPRNVVGSRHEVEDRAFFIAARVADFQFQHEAVDLRFGQWISAFLFDRVLSRQDQKRFLETKCLVADGDLLLLHRFEQCALDFGRGAVDFVGKNQIGEDRAFTSCKATRLRVVNLRADDIGGKHVGRELEA